MYVLQLQSQYEFITFHNSIQMLTLLTKLLTFMLNLGQQRKTKQTNYSCMFASNTTKCWKQQSVDWNTPDWSLQQGFFLHFFCCLPEIQRLGEAAGRDIPGQCHGSPFSDHANANSVEHHHPTSTNSFKEPGISKFQQCICWHDHYQWMSPLKNHQPLCHSRYKPLQGLMRSGYCINCLQ